MVTHTEVLSRHGFANGINACPFSVFFSAHALMVSQQHKARPRMERYVLEVIDDYKAQNNESLEQMKRGIY